MGDGWETARKITRPAILEAGDGGLIKVGGTTGQLGHSTAANRRALYGG